MKRTFNSSSHNPTFWLVSLSIMFVFSPGALAQDAVQVRMFGHLESVTETYPVAHDGHDHASWGTGFSIGEHDMFVTARISDRISFLSETVVGPASSHGHGAGGDGFMASIERARIKFDYAPNHSVIVGKMHTPVNYWNDTYHHGRLFFPTIDRPSSFGLVMPIHTLGVRLQGQNIGDLNFGYDVVAGNGLSSSDAGDDDISKSLTAAVHIKPFDDSRFGVSYYMDNIRGNRVGSHGGHSGGHWSQVLSDSDPTNDSLFYAGDVNFQLACASFRIQKPNWETLVELAFNRNAYEDDAMTTTSNVFGFGYLGRVVNDETFYGLVDYTLTAEEDRHYLPQELTKLGLGWKHEFTPGIHIKTQIERYVSWRLDPVTMERAPGDKWEFKVQLAYGFGG